MNLFTILKSGLVLIFDGEKENDIERMQALIFCGIIYNIIYWRKYPWKTAVKEILLEFIFIDCLTLMNAFSPATEMSILVSLNRSRVVQKAGIKNTFVFLAFWNSPAISYPLFRWGYLDYHLIWGESLAR